jgi:hypothetical protein
MLNQSSIEPSDSKVDVEMTDATVHTHIPVARQVSQSPSKH